LAYGVYYFFGENHLNGTLPRWLDGLGCHTNLIKSRFLLFFFVRKQMGKLVNAISKYVYMIMYTIYYLYIYICKYIYIYMPSIYIYIPEKVYIKLELAGNQQTSKMILQHVSLF
jgi:hypothetical protein